MIDLLLAMHVAMLCCFETTDNNCKISIPKRMSKTPAWIEKARSAWTNTGKARPAFAVQPKEGQESCWDFPRPPRLEPTDREIVVKWGEHEIARTTNAIRLLETSHPPTYYIPLKDVQKKFLVAESGSGSFCEWKGPAQYWSLVDGDKQLHKVAWSYPQPLAGAESISESVAFYAHALDCTVGGNAVKPQAGGFYGGWITADVVGPFKGDPGTSSW